MLPLKLLVTPLRKTSFIRLDIDKSNPLPTLNSKFN